MKGNNPSRWLLLTATLFFYSCGGGEEDGLTPVETSELPPRFINYPDPNNFIQGVPIDPLVPTYVGGKPTNYLVQPDLPAGLRLDHLGVISGTPTERTAPNTYIVTAGNSAGTATFGVRITVGGRYTVGGIVVGLVGGGLVLSNNGVDLIEIAADGPFVFPETYPVAHPVKIAVVSQPADQVCTVANGVAILANDDYGAAVVTCITTL